jgi:putative transposase
LKYKRNADADLAQTNFSSCQATLRRLERAFDAFFRRIQRGESAGYPRFEGYDRFHTVEFASYGDGCKIEGGRVYFQHVGKLRIVMHRPVRGTIKTLSFTRHGDNWYLLAVCDLGDIEPRRHNGCVVGVDVGLTKFASLSNGEQIDNPRFFRAHEHVLARVQRKMSKFKVGTKDRLYCKKIVRRIYRGITDHRTNFAHQLSHHLVNRFSLIVFEELYIARMLKHPTLAKSMSDTAWRKTITYTQYKAEEAGARCIVIDPRGTSQRCSRCSTTVKKNLSVRVHSCPACGLNIDRDVNAALNILGVGLHSLGLTPSSHDRMIVEQSLGEDEVQVNYVRAGQWNCV